MKTRLLLIIVILSMVSGGYFPYAFAQEANDTLPTITPQTARHMVEIAQITIQPNFIPQYDYQIALHTDRLAIVIEGNVHLYSLPELSFLQDLGQGDALQFSPDGAYLTYRSADNRLIVWDMAAQSLYQAIGPAVIHWHFSDDGRLIVRQVDSIQIYAADSLREIASIPAEWEYFNEILAPNGDWVAYNNAAAQTIDWWDRATDTISMLDPGGMVMALTAAPNSQFLAALILATDDSFVIRVWEATSLAEIGALSVSSPYMGPAHTDPFIDFSADGSQLAWAMSKYDETTGILSPAVGVWNITTDAEMATLTGADLFDYPLSFNLAPDGSWVMLEARNQMGHAVSTIWDTAQRTQLATLDTQRQHTFSPDGRLIAMIPYRDNTREHTELNNTVELWDMNTGTYLYRLWHDTPVHAVVFAPDASLIFTLTQDGMGHVWAASSAD